MGADARRTWRGLRPATNLLVDLSAIAAIWAALTGWGLRGAVAGATAAAAWGVGSYVVRFYDPWGPRSWLDELALACLVDGGAIVALAVVGTLGMHFGLRNLAALGFPLVLAAVMLPRWVLFQRLLPSAPPEDEVLIVGTGALGRSTAQTLSAPRSRVRIAGFLRLRDQRCGATLDGLPVLGDLEALQSILRTRPIAEVYLAGDPLRNAKDFQLAISDCERLGVPFALPACAFRLGRARPAHPNAVADGYLHFLTHEARPYQHALKRLFDIFASAAALVVLSPLLLLVAALIKLTSRGPVFFKQERVGLHGRHFFMFKFRTMIPNADALKDQLRALNEQTGPVFKIKNDPRVTPIGRILRKHSIDELPQLLNVLRGDMSIVGPRPPVPREVAEYQAWQRRRLSVRPGLTCIWQVSGRDQITFEEWMYLDMRYIDHWSFRKDLQLVLKTIPVVLTGKGAS